MSESEKAQKLAAARKKLKEFKQKQKTNKKVTENEKHSEVCESLTSSSHSSINGIYAEPENHFEKNPTTYNYFDANRKEDEIKTPLNKEDSDFSSNLHAYSNNVANSEVNSAFQQFNVINFENGAPENVISNIFDELSKQNPEETESKKSDEKESFIKAFHNDNNEVTNFPSVQQNFPIPNQDFPLVNQNFAIANQDFPPINQNFPFINQDFSNTNSFNQDYHVSSQNPFDVNVAYQNLPAFDENIPKVNEIPIPKQDLITSQPESEREQNGESNMSNIQTDHSEKKVISNTESLKQLSSQISSLISESEGYSQQAPSDKDLLERRNQELAAELQNSQIERDKLRAQLEERENRIKTLEAECEKGRIELQTRINREIGPLQEQLQTHTQTLGILVAEKTELSTALTQSQLMVKQKITECEELQGRLRTSRCRVADLEKELNLVRAEKTKLEQILKSQDIEGKNQEFNQIKDQLNEATQDLLEMREKYNAKDEESKKLQGHLQEVTHQLSMTQLRLQQVTAGEQVQNDARLEAIVQEKIQLEKQVKELSDSLKATANERDQSSLQYQQYTEQLNEQVSNLANRLQSLTQENERLSIREQELVNHIGELEKRLQNLQDERLKVLSPTEAPSNGNMQELQELQQEKETLTIKCQQLLEDKKILEEEIHFHEEKERELEEQLEQLRENRPDLTKLMASMESDKVAAARATAQNTKLKEQLEEMQKAFVKSSNDKMELMEKLMSIQHQNKEVNEKCELLQNQLDKLTNAINIKDQELLRERESLETINKRLIQLGQLEDRLRHYEAQDSSFGILQNELQQTKQQLQALVAENHQLKEVIRSNKGYMSQEGSIQNEQPVNDTKSVGSGASNDEAEEDVQVQTLIEENHRLKETLSQKEEVVELEKDALMEQVRAKIAQLEERNKQLELQIYKQTKETLTSANKPDLINDESDRNKESLMAEVGANDADMSTAEGDADNVHLNKEKAMQFLEEKFLRTMQDVARLTEEKQRLEHLVTQLQGETETIGEYIALYQHQRAILHQRTLEKDEQLKRLQEDRTQIKAKLDLLNSLVKKLVQEKGATMTSDLFEQQHQPQENGNDKLCSEHAFIHEELNRIKQENMLDVSKVSSDERGDSEKGIDKNATAQQIITLLSEIKASSLIQSDANDNFHPCAWCSGQLITV